MSKNYFLTSLFLSTILVSCGGGGGGVVVNRMVILAVGMVNLPMLLQQLIMQI
jgi:hypothetical protein